MSLNDVAKKTHRTGSVKVPPTLVEINPEIPPKTPPLQSNQLHVRGFAAHLASPGCPTI